MLFQSVVACALAGLTIANPVVVKDSLYPRSEQDVQAAADTVAIKGLITVISQVIIHH